MRAQRNEIHLLRHLNEIGLVIPFSFLMMEILKFLACLLLAGIDADAATADSLWLM